MLTFVHPALLWGLLLAGVPVLIHLVNLLRHRRIRWAAMEFLRASQKKNRIRVLLVQLLLLAVRMLAIALLVMVLAQPLVDSRWGRVLGGHRTHHIVLLDDSFSMSDRWADTSAFEQAKAVIQRIADQAGRQAGPHSLTLLRFSQAAGGTSDAQPDLVATRDWGRGARREAQGVRAWRDASRDSLAPSPSSLAPDSGGPLRELLDSLGPSHTAAGPTGSLEAAADWVDEPSADLRIVYLISDFRARQWDQPAATNLRSVPGNLLARISRAGAKVYLIHCVRSARPNLAIAGLSPAPGTRAAGVPLSMEVTVENFSDVPQRDVPVLIRTDGHLQPAIKIALVPPRLRVKERFSVYFPLAGEHVIGAELEADAVAVDNSRYAVIDVPEEVPVLLIDGDPEAPDARYLSAALAPGGPVRTGIRPRIEPARYLSQNELERFAAIYLLNVDRLQRQAIERLEGYLAAGGGVAVFLGPRCNTEFFNDQLYRGGEGFFPVPLAGEAELVVDRLQDTCDLRASSHPIFRVFAGQRNPFLRMVMIRRYFRVAPPEPEGERWKVEPGEPRGALGAGLPTSPRTARTSETLAQRGEPRGAGSPPSSLIPRLSPPVRVIASLRNGAPLAVQRRFGRGRVVAMLTTAGPTWNNWARNNPSFVVAMLELQAFLATRPDEDPLGGEWQVASGQRTTETGELRGADSRRWPPGTRHLEPPSRAGAKVVRLPPGPGLPGQSARTNLVGTPLELRLDPSQYAARVRFSFAYGPQESRPGGALERRFAARSQRGRESVVPEGASGGARRESGEPAALVLQDAGEEGLSVDAVFAPDGSLTASFPAANSSGVYEAALERKDAAHEVRSFAFNVQAEEGDLRTVSASQLAERLSGVRYQYEQADRFQYAAGGAAGHNLSDLLLYLLILALVGEQVLAWWASYHPRKSGKWRVEGGEGGVSTRARRRSPDLAAHGAHVSSPSHSAVGSKQ